MMTPINKPRPHGLHKPHEVILTPLPLHSLLILLSHDKKLSPLPLRKPLYKIKYLQTLYTLIPLGRTDLAIRPTLTNTPKSTKA